ncbi:hypothetical protein CEXT_605281 [Caerostris extrusa]|uniref:Uncharacterized protein n=1 Tax=Caerostris extrusa TaxID=172846 RepID=A0AAV4TYG5_CAEEX|nr:hypothetical protein CEXT_605281 [Caerostris extrusa]
MLLNVTSIPAKALEHTLDHRVPSVTPNEHCLVTRKTQEKTQIETARFLVLRVGGDLRLPFKHLLHEDEGG